VLRSGVLVTNRPVVDEARRVQINTWDGASLEGRFVAVAFYSDLALVALDANDSTSMGSSVARLNRSYALLSRPCTRQHSPPPPDTCCHSSTGYQSSS
jgi:S1-C subfamily serine protease